MTARLHCRRGGQPDSLARHINDNRARSATGRTTITKRAADVAGFMNLQHNTPNVVNARRGRKFEELAGVAVTGRTGLEHDPNTEFTYAIDTSHRIANDPRNRRMGTALATTKQERSG